MSFVLIEVLVGVYGLDLFAPIQVLELPVSMRSVSAVALVKESLQNGRTELTLRRRVPHVNCTREAKSSVRCGNGPTVFPFYFDPSTYQTCCMRTVKVDEFLGAQSTDPGRYGQD